MPQNTECNKIKYLNLKMYCDGKSRNVGTQYVAQHLLTLQSFSLKMYNVAASDYTGKHNFCHK
jgi:hypothetical protein